MILFSFRSPNFTPAPREVSKPSLPRLWRDLLPSKNGHTRKRMTVFISVGVTGFELMTSPSRTVCSTKLRHTPNYNYYFLRQQNREKHNGHIVYRGSTRCLARTTIRNYDISKSIVPHDYGDRRFHPFTSGSWTWRIELKMIAFVPVSKWTKVAIGDWIVRSCR